MMPITMRSADRPPMIDPMSFRHLLCRANKHLVYIGWRHRKRRGQRAVDARPMISAIGFMVWCRAGKEET
jgi:hypothetical protein